MPEIRYHMKDNTNIVVENQVISIDKARASRKRRSRARSVNTRSESFESVEACQQAVKQILDTVVDSDENGEWQYTVDDIALISKDLDRGLGMYVAQKFRSKYAVQRVKESNRFFVSGPGNIWVPDEKLVMFAEDSEVARVLELARRKFAEALNALDRGMAQFDNDADLSNLRKDLTKWDKNVGSALSKVNQYRSFHNIIKRAALGEYGWIVPLQEWDQDRGTLTTDEGIVDLNTGEVRSCRPEDYRSRRTGTVLPPAECEMETPVWDATLRSIFSQIGRPNEPEPGEDGNVSEEAKAAYDQAMADWESGRTLDEFLSFFQETVGSSVFGYNREQKFYIWIGERGRNGKGLIMHTLQAVLGDYFGETRSETFMRGKRNQDSGCATPQLMALSGKRLVVCQESDASDTLNSSLIKRVTGGDRLSVRALYGEEQEVDVTWTPIIVTNYFPRFDTEDDALFVRTCVIPFQNSFAGKEDRDLENKLVAEYPGILKWIVDGAMRYAERGHLVIPPYIARTGEVYRKDRDSLAEFISTYCEQGKSAYCPVTDLFGAFSQCLYESGMKEWNRATFKERMRRKGYITRKHSVERFQGLSLTIGADEENGCNLLARWKGRKQRV